MSARAIEASILQRFFSSDHVFLRGYVHPVLLASMLASLSTMACQRHVTSNHPFKTEGGRSLLTF